ncbi:MAG: bifunctional precorrin-2 dehydrogenase/sirohydrochlorin ferrochelatase [Candidatus Methanoperedens sp.]|nr:bifunctional precorrin-2 dehydrogenase/sirohydrochlorin ferrochelatase [Candidatus Methanoperedens sp.]
MIDLHEKEIVIFGGGGVGERKASFFCEHGKVKIISKEFTPGLDILHKKGKIELIKINDINDNEIASFLNNAFIVIPATNDTVFNDKIARIAKYQGKFINRVDDIGDIIIPSVITRADIVIGISTGGHSPALSKYIRHKIEGVITPEFAQMSRLQSEIREKLKSVVEEQKKRKDILWNIINDNDVWDSLRESYEKAYMTASKHIRQNENTER